MDQIEIYVRPSGDQTLLNFHIPSGLKERFIQGLQSGSFECSDGEINLEMHVFPEHVTDEEQSNRVMKNGEPIHIRRGITSINILNGD